MATKEKVVEVKTLVPVMNEFDGGRRTDCKEAAKLLKSGKATKAYFRPLSVTITRKVGDPLYSDNDPAWVWET